MTTPLTVVMPVYDEAAHLAATVEALSEAAERSPFDVELLLVDDGSTDGSADVARAAAEDRLAFRVVSQPNRGRFEARRAGLEAAVTEWVLLLDGRVRLDPEALAFVHERVGEGGVWNGHVEIDAAGTPYGTFWKLIAELAWADYFADPRETSFGSEDFDRYPKGTTCLLAPRALLLAAVEAFASRYEDLRLANDDTPLLRWIAERTRINLAPTFRCTYSPRSSFRPFVRHSVHRGVVFVDGHGRPESRFFPLVVAFFPVSALVALRALRKPSTVLTTALAVSAAAAALGAAKRRSPLEIASLALLAPVYGVAHGIGMWRGLWTIVRRPR
jgi:glycosyltransferase involved in cell wall biosynthesis